MDQHVHPSAQRGLGGLGQPFGGIGVCKVGGQHRMAFAGQEPPGLLGGLRVGVEVDCHAESGGGEVNGKGASDAARGPRDEGCLLVSHAASPKASRTARYAGP